MDQYVNADRTVHYFELLFKYYSDKEETKPYKNIFKHINDLCLKQDPKRIVATANGRLFFSTLKYVPSKQQIRGKLLFVREDFFPQIINLTDEKIRDLQVEVDEGMLETTHFILDYSTHVPKLALEYNHFGARISDFIYYIKKFSREIRIAITCDPKFLVHDRLKEVKKRINRLSKVRVKVHKDNVKRITSADTGLGTALFHAQNCSFSDEVELTMFFDYKRKTSTTGIRDIVTGFIDRFIKTPETLNHFEAFEVHAEDEAQNNKIEMFNLLMDKIKSEIPVQKKLKSRVIKSSTFFDKTEEAMDGLFKLGWTN